MVIYLWYGDLLKKVHPPYTRRIISLRHYRLVHRIRDCNAKRHACQSTALGTSVKH